MVLSFFCCKNNIAEDIPTTKFQQSVVFKTDYLHLFMYYSTKLISPNNLVTFFISQSLLMLFLLFVHPLTNGQREKCFNNHTDLQHQLLT